MKMSRPGWLKPAQYQVLPGGTFSWPTLTSSWRSNLPLRSVEHHPDPVFAIQKLNVVKHIALIGRGLGEAEQLVVAIDFGLPARRQIAFETRAVERGLSVQRTIGDHGPAAPRRRACQAAIEALDVAEAEVGGVGGAEQVPVGIGAIGPEPERRGNPSEWW